MNVEPEKIEMMVSMQKEYFDALETRSIDFRITQLKTLKATIQKYEEEIIEALRMDLGKSEFEGYVTEVGFVYNSISHTIKHLKKWAKPKRVGTPLSLQVARSKIYNDPYGVVLIIGPFNYPFQLTIEPLIGAIAAGNCAVIKPSEEAYHTAQIVDKIITEAFDQSFVCVIQGQKETTTQLLTQPFGLIFFTGSVGVGKIIMEAASKQLIPVVLELGGKSPVIVDSSANLDLAAKRII